MARKRFSPEQIIGMLREAEVRLSQGEKVKGICRGLGITEQTYYRWRKDYGGMKVSQARRLKELERESGRLKKAVAELTLDKLILKEALEVVLPPPERTIAPWLIRKGLDKRIVERLN
jgi:putative transposase